MKKIIPIMALLMASATVQAQKISVTQKVIDLGQVQYYSPTTGTYEFKNTGLKSLKITKVDTGCGCTVASYPTNGISAGQKFEIKVTYDARQMGHFDKVIEVYSNASEEPVELDLRGQVVETVEDYSGDFPFTLGTLTADCNYVEFEDVRLGEVLQLKFHVYNPTGKTVNPQIMHLPAYLKADVSPSAVKPNHSAEVTLTLDSRKIREYGLTQTQIYLGANPGEKVASSKEIGVSAVLVPGFTDLTLSQLENAPHLKMSQSSLNMPISDGKKRTETVELTNVGNSRLEIQNLQMFTTGMKVQLNKRFLDPGESAKLKITTDPQLLRNVKTMPRVIMITNDPDNGKVIIYVNIK